MSGEVRSEAQRAEARTEHLTYRLILELVKIEMSFCGTKETKQKKAKEDKNVSLCDRSFV